MELKTFVVFKDQEGIIRLQTKIVYRDDCGAFMKPAILYSQQETVRNLRYFYHVRNRHVVLIFY